MWYWPRFPGTKKRLISRLFSDLEHLKADAKFELSQIDVFAVASGPGSFTGLRIGLTAVKAWAEVHGKPIAYLLLSAIVEKVTGQPYFTYVQQKVLAPLGITEVLLSSTEAQQRDPSEAICEDQGLGLDPINITSNLQIPAVYGGDGQIKEVAAACAGLAASATALTQFIHTNLVWGNGPRPTGGGNWWIGRTGSTPGTSTEAVSLGGGLDWAYVINTRDFPPQTPLPLASLATTIGNIISSTPGL